MSRSLKEMPICEPIESKYTVEEIRTRLSGIFKSKCLDNSEQLAVLELILCLANEIQDLKTQLNNK